MWRDLEASFCYNHWEEKVVVALVSESPEIQVSPPLEIRAAGGERALSSILAQPPETPGTLPRLPERVRAMASSGSALLLFPTGPDEVLPVASNWVALLEGERWGGGAEKEGHLFFVSFEVGDDWNAYARFLRPERALWQALHHFHPSRSTEYHLRVVEEAIELGELVTARFFEGGRRSYHTAIQALCDTAARIMVLEKREGMIAVVRETGGHPEVPRGPSAQDG